MQAIKRISKYLKIILEFRLSHPGNKYFILETYIDADWERSIDDRKSISGGVFFLGNYLVSWLGKKQSPTSLSIEKTEYIAATSYCT